MIQIQYMCTSYVSSLVQDSNAKVLSCVQKFKHTNSIGSHSKHVRQSWFKQNKATKNTNTTTMVSTIQATESDGPTDPGRSK